MSDKFPIDVTMVQRLVASQFPPWADLPIRPVAWDGWDNRTFHLGDRMKVRLPSAAGYVEQAGKEHLWLPRLAPYLPLPVPVPLALGQPGEGYPWPWSIYEWIEGDLAAPDRIGDMNRFATDVASFLKALQRIDTAGGPPPGSHNFHRGAPLDVYDGEARAAIETLGGRIDGALATAVCDAALGARSSARPVWVHGDIAASNLLVNEGRLSAVIDFGCCAVGDPACDLVLTWVFLSGESREAFRAAIEADDDLWTRARGWALWKAVIVLAAGRGRTNPAEAAPEEVIEAVLAEHRALSRKTAPE